MKSHLEFKEIPNEGKETKKWEVYSTYGDGPYLGSILWWGAWRAYVFFPDCETFFSWDCLRELSEFIKVRMDERKRCAVSLSVRNGEVLQ